MLWFLAACAFAAMVAVTWWAYHANERDDAKLPEEERRQREHW